MALSGSFLKIKASKSSGQDLKFATPTANALEENAKLREHIARLKEELASKNLELRRGVPVPYGAYCSSGATPQLLDLYLEKVLIDLSNFVYFSIPLKTSIEIANSLKARVSDILFSKFEQNDFGVKGEKFTNPGLLIEKSFKEFGAFAAYSDYPEDEAVEEVKPFLPRYERFLEFKKEKILRACGQGSPENQWPRVEFNDSSSAHFCNLAMNVWMLHKLTFSFERANVILMRVVRDEPFLDKFMRPVGQHDENQLKGKPPAAATTVKHVILPGLWINDSIIKCRVCLGSPSRQEPSNAPAAQLQGDDAVQNGTERRNVGATSKQAHQPTSSQVPDTEAHAHAHQQTQAMEHTVTVIDEPHAVPEASHSRLPDEELGEDETPAVKEDQAAQEVTNLRTLLVNSPPEELEEESPPHPPFPMPVTEHNYYSPRSKDPYHGSTYQRFQSFGPK